MWRTRVSSLFSLTVSSAAVSCRLLPAATTATQQHRHYAKPLAGLGKKGKMKLGPTMEKVRLPVESDAEKLVTHVMGSHPVKEGREDVKLKDDSEYPDWLWTLRTGKPPPLHELDSNSKEYWKRLRNLALKEQNKLKKLKKF
ncbi:39S ribosomal protein L54, mitochondrial [Chionoecetes opilio]|uniref:Large ribosomal subunit protein mL54 n=1 Tax=Chionoecetes opilio TaxID=41210 RepID=A0A8J4XW49_CHIOP|nr:39S ribosomal protein L54, mitochondrial [Chionoecetes opilio]